MSDNKFQYVRPAERARLQRWGIKEASVDVSFITTPDGWNLAVSHYRDNDQQPTTQRYPVLLCHGLGANRLAWDVSPDYSLPAWLTSLGFDVYSLELRGHGLSEKPGQARKRWGWGFNEYCEIDIPAAIDFVLERTGSDALHFIGHSLGGILLYGRAAMLDARIRSGITIGSTLDYSGLPTAFRAIAPLAPLSHLLPFVPIHWAALLQSQISGYSPRLIDSMMVCPENVDVELYRRMAANMLHPVSARLLRDLSGIIQGRGVVNSKGQRYDELLQSCGYTFPILAMAGSVDSQCPPVSSARFGTAHLAFGKEQGHRENYGHHDLIMGKHAREEVWPSISEWLLQHD